MSKNILAYKYHSKWFYYPQFGFIPQFFKMESRHCHYHIVSDKVPCELRPFMAAFIGYFLQSSADRNRHLRSRAVKGLFWRLACFLGYIDKHVTFYDFYLGVFDFPKYVIRDYVTKEDGTIMTLNEQLKLFAEILKDKKYPADIFLYQEGHEKPIEKIHVSQESKSVIPIIRLLDGRFATTSIHNSFSFNLKQYQLRIETCKQRKEKRIAKNKKYFSKLLVALNK